MKSFVWRKKRQRHNNNLAMEPKSATDRMSSYWQWKKKNIQNFYGMYVYWTIETNYVYRPIYSSLSVFSFSFSHFSLLRPIPQVAMSQNHKIHRKRLKEKNTLINLMRNLVFLFRIIFCFYSSIHNFLMWPTYKQRKGFHHVYKRHMFALIKP